MCLGIPARVLSVQGSQVTLDLRGREIQADATMVPVTPGEFVLVYSGLIVQVLPASEAEEILRTLADVSARPVDAE